MPENYTLLIVYILCGIVVGRALMAPRAYRQHEESELTTYDVARSNGFTRREARRIARLDSQMIRSEPTPKKRLGSAEQHD